VDKPRTLWREDVSDERLRLTQNTMTRRQPSGGVERISTLDGLRGIAVLLVLLMHFTPDYLMNNRALEWFKKLLQAGWIGVDLFFVLSGFLITRILLREKGAPNYFKNFYARRALRIFPLYFVTLFIFIHIIPLLGMGSIHEVNEVQSMQIWQWLYLTNFGLWLHGSRGFSAGFVEFRHFWSLAVEEHFYIVWPAVVLLCNPRQLRIVCLSLMTIALLIRVGYYCASSPVHSANYFYVLTFCRFDALAAGAFIAALLGNATTKDLRSVLRNARLIQLAIALILIISAYWMKGLWSGSAFMKTIGFTLVAIGFGALLVDWTLSDESAIQKRIGNSSMLGFFGKYSYGLYIIHGVIGPALNFVFPVETWLECLSEWPLLRMLSLLLVKIGICIPIAMISWFVLENRFMALRRHFVTRAS
jgi:peptidoglycan/LPS O-acetylase OafA/YrhL